MQYIGLTDDNQKRTANDEMDTCCRIDGDTIARCLRVN